EIAYGRGAGTLSRLMSWLDVLEAVNNELSGLKREEFLIIDPDSRLTQLGLLPLVKNDENYLPFESRKFQRQEPTHLGQLVSRWLDEWFDLNGEVFPFVALPHQHQRFGQMIKNSLGRTGHARLAAVSFGTGGNDRKRISDELEHKLVDHLLTERAVIL